MQIWPRQWRYGQQLTGGRSGDYFCSSDTMTALPNGGKYRSGIFTAAPIRIGLTQASGCDDLTGFMTYSSLWSGSSWPRINILERALWPQYPYPGANSLPKKR